MAFQNKGEQLQPNKAEQVATKMFNVADKIDGSKQPELQQNFNQAANEFASEGYDKGQRILEKGGAWNDEVRGAASEANQAGREKIGASPLSFAEAKSAMQKMATELGGQGTPDDRRAALAIESIVSGTERPGQTGIEGIDQALQYIEGVLQNRASSTNPEGQKTRDEQRGIRDALYAEKQKRIEKQKQTQQAGEHLNLDRVSTGRTLENLFDNASLPENSPVRQILLRKSKEMSSEELRFFNAELRKAAGNFNAIGDPKRLETTLSDLVDKKFSKDETAKRGKQEDEAELAKIRNVLNQETEPKEQLPNDVKNLERYFVKNFRDCSQLPLNEFKKAFTPQMEQKFQQWAEQRIGAIIKEQAAGVSTPDNVRQVFNLEGEAILQRIIALKTGKVVDLAVLRTVPFSQVAKDYLNIKLPTDYSKHFSPKPLVRF